jgi:hypothetical protein
MNENMEFLNIIQNNDLQTVRMMLENPYINFSEVLNYTDVIMKKLLYYIIKMKKCMIYYYLFKSLLIIINND